MEIYLGIFYLHMICAWGGNFDDRLLYRNKRWAGCDRLDEFQVRAGCGYNGHCFGRGNSIVVEETQLKVGVFNYDLEPMICDLWIQC